MNKIIRNIVLVLCFIMIIIIVVLIPSKQPAKSTISSGSKSHLQVFNIDEILNKEQSPPLEEKVTIIDKPEFIKLDNSFSLSNGTTIMSYAYYASYPYKSNNSFEITATILGTTYTFTFVNRSTTSFDLLHYLVGQEYYLQRIPLTETYIMEFNQNLYVLDPALSSITPLLKDNINGIAIEDLYNIYFPYFTPAWANDALLSPDGSKVIFKSNRNVLVDEKNDTQIWVKYLDSREEFPLLNGYYSIVGFTKKDEVLYVENDAIKRININSGEIDHIIDFTLDKALADPYLVYQPDYGSLNVLNINTKEVTPLSISNLGAVYHLKIDPSSRYIVFINQPDRTKLEQEIIVYDIEKKQYRRFVSNDSFQIGWINISSADYFDFEYTESGKQTETYQFEFSKLFNEK